MVKYILRVIGLLLAKLIRLWVRVTGRKVRKIDAPWLQCPMGPAGTIGVEFYTNLANGEGLSIEDSADAGLIPDFNVLASDDFKPDYVIDRVRDFYERTSRYTLEAWSEAPFPTRIFLWGLTRCISRQMNQLNFPVSSLELAGGMSSKILPMVDGDGQRIYTGWSRCLIKSKQVIYTGLYSSAKPGGDGPPCVKVSFPLPLGSATVFLRPVVEEDGSFRLISSGSCFGDPGFYRMVEVDEDHWRVRYIKTLREFFHVYVDERGTLRTDHLVRFLGLTVLRLHYRLERNSTGGD
ncbi:MAG TPA: hypothetical protein DCG12_00450 [Planctomycetaceae bacterium]|nr:hypothetical protein [Planctomycetaceae bacterium]